MNKRGTKIGCGCCVGPEEDRCCCQFHQDATRGLTPHKCSLHQASFQVETYCSGHPYKIQQFSEISQAYAYQAELHKAGHYFVPIIDLRSTSSRDQYGTRIDWSTEDQSNW